MTGECVKGSGLLLAQSAEESNRDVRSILSMVFDLDFDLMRLQQPDGFLQTPARQRDMVRMQGGARHDAGFPVGWQSHGLRAVELGILESGKTDEPCLYRGRQSGTVDVDLICEHDCDTTRQRTGDWRRFAPPRRWHQPRHLGVFILDRHPDAKHAAANFGFPDQPRNGAGLQSGQ